jgi:hypothetical protein
MIINKNFIVKILDERQLQQQQQNHLLLDRLSILDLVSNET